jgi:23S rRNA (guanosine2251-2'-O)-methyltransferase
VRTALKQGQGAVSAVWVDAGRKDRRAREILALAQQIGVTIHRVSAPDLQRLAGGLRHQGVVARASLPAARDESLLRSLLERPAAMPLLLVLDSVQDPHNLGACLRTAEAAGAQAVVAPRDRAVGLTSTVCKVASGAASTLPYIQVTNLARTLRWLRDESNLWVIGTAGGAPRSLFEVRLDQPLALVLGAEGQGLRRLTRELCDELVRLPMAGTVESLNVSVAAGICLYEAVRQRRHPAASA